MIRFSRRFAAAVLISCAVLGPAAAQTVPAITVLELFTSQGCSSCPAADALFKSYVERPDVMALSYSVDYWDYLGWKDTLASPKFTERQRAYGKSVSNGRIYTPQMVINGDSHAVGSNQDTVQKAIASARRRVSNLQLHLSATEKELIVNLPKGEAGVEATLWILAVAPVVTVIIERGENSGKSITYQNVVRNLVPAGMWDGSAATLKLPRKGIMTGDSKSCIAVLQKGKVGPVLGMAQWQV